MSLKRRIRQEKERLEKQIKEQIIGRIGDQFKFDVYVSDIDLENAEISVTFDSSSGNEDQSKVSKQVFKKTKDGGQIVESTNYTVLTKDGSVVGTKANTDTISFQLGLIIFQVIAQTIQEENEQEEAAEKEDRKEESAIKDEGSR